MENKGTLAENLNEMYKEIFGTFLTDEEKLTLNLKPCPKDWAESYLLDYGFNSLDDFDQNGWQWDYWESFQHEDGRKIKLSGSGYYGEASFDKEDWEEDEEDFELVVTKDIMDYYYNLLTSGCTLLPYNGAHEHEIRIVLEDFEQVVTEEFGQVSEEQYINVFWDSEWDDTTIINTNIVDAILAMISIENECTIDQLNLEGIDYTPYGYYPKK